MSSQPATSQPAKSSQNGRAKRSSGCAKITLFSLVLIVALTVVVTVVGERYARSEIERSVASSMTTSLKGQTTVEIEDRFVLLALARQRFEAVSGSAPKATLSDGDQSVSVTDLMFRATGVTNLRGTGPLKAESLRASALISYAELSRLANTEITSAGSDRVKVHQTATIWGASVAIDITAKPGVSGGKLTLAEPQATLSGIEVPETLLRPLLARITAQSTLPKVQGLGYDSLAASPQGIKVGLSGSGVELPR